MVSQSQSNGRSQSSNVFPYVHTMPPASTTFPRVNPVVHTIEFLLSFKDHPNCKDKPSDLPDFIDKDKVVQDGPGGKPIRKQRRPGPADADNGGEGIATPGTDGEAAGPSDWGKGKGARRRDQGWQPAHTEHQDDEARGKGHPRQQRIVPGKGMRGSPSPTPVPPAAQLAPGAKWEHQPALANVYTKQHQGVTGAPTQVAKGLDAFTMGDIRQAERLIENGRMNIDEYARRVASGEINKAAASSVGGTGSFFAEEDDNSSRQPWMAGGRIIPGTQAAPRPSAPAVVPPTGPVGKDSNLAGLALLQMLVDKKAAAAAPTARPVAPPRQLSQQQLNELIAMSKRTAAAPKPKAQIIPGQHSRAAPATPTTPTNPQVAALLEQLQRQQMAQQQSHGMPPSAPPAGTASPPECQQQ